LRLQQNSKTISRGRKKQRKGKSNFGGDPGKELSLDLLSGGKGKSGWRAKIGRAAKKLTGTGLFIGTGELAGDLRRGGP